MFNQCNGGILSTLTHFITVTLCNVSADNLDMMILDATCDEAGIIQHVTSVSSR